MIQRGEVGGGGSALDSAQKKLGANRAGRVLVARHQGSRSLQADDIGQLAQHAQKTIQALKTKKYIQ